MGTITQEQLDAGLDEASIAQIAAVGDLGEQLGYLSDFNAAAYGFIDAIKGNEAAPLDRNKWQKSIMNENEAFSNVADALKTLIGKGIVNMSAQQAMDGLIPVANGAVAPVLAGGKWNVTSKTGLRWLIGSGFNMHDGAIDLTNSNWRAQGLTTNGSSIVSMFEGTASYGWGRDLGWNVSNAATIYDRNDNAVSFVNSNGHMGTAGLLDMIGLAFTTGSNVQFADGRITMNVLQGVQIGHTGTSGSSSGQHLHTSIAIDKIRVADALAWMDNGTGVALTMMNREGPPVDFFNVTASANLYSGRTGGYKTYNPTAAALAEQGIMASYPELGTASYELVKYYNSIGWDKTAVLSGSKPGDAMGQGLLSAAYFAVEQEKLFKQYGQLSAALMADHVKQEAQKAADLAKRQKSYYSAYNAYANAQAQAQRQLEETMRKWREMERAWNSGYRAGSSRPY
jgi:hypothetical protein